MTETRTNPEFEPRQTLFYAVFFGSIFNELDYISTHENVLITSYI